MDILDPVFASTPAKFEGSSFVGKGFESTEGGTMLGDWGMSRVVSSDFSGLPEGTIDISRKVSSI